MVISHSGSINTDGLQEILDEILQYSLESNTRGKKKRRIESLDETFWNFVGEKISQMLVKNYNQIRILNKPDYYRWKQKARDNGISVVVTETGEEADVKYIRPALRTGTLRERIRNVTLNSTSINGFRSNNASIEYEINVSDLKNDYGNRFEELILEKTGQDLMFLTDQQADEILELIINRFLGAE